MSRPTPETSPERRAFALSMAADIIKAAAGDPAKLRGGIADALCQGLYLEMDGGNFLVAPYQAAEAAYVLSTFEAALARVPEDHFDCLEIVGQYATGHLTLKETIDGLNEDMEDMEDAPVSEDSR